jgi:hypothetical protein
MDRGRNGVKTRQEETKAIEHLVLGLERAVKGVMMYPPGHPNCESFITASHNAFSSFLSGFHQFRLLVNRHDLTFGDESVYRNTDNNESLAFALYRDGVREISFHKGLARDEILDFCRAFSMKFDSEELDSDLVTYLWEKDLANIKIIVIEDFLEEYIPEKLRDAEDLEGAARELIELKSFTPQELRDLILTRPLSSTKQSTIPLKNVFLSPAMLRLLPQELHHLRESISREQDDIPFKNMLEIILSVLSQDMSDEGTTLFVALFRNLLQMLLTSGPLEHACIFIERIQLFANESADLSPRLTRQIDTFLRELGSEEYIHILGESLRLDRLPDIDHLPRLLAFFPPTSLRDITELFESTKSMKTRRLLCQALAQLGERNFNGLLRFLSDDRWFIVRNIAYTLGIIGTNKVVPHLEGLLDYPDRRVRKEALRALGVIGTPRACRAIVKGMHHEEEVTRRQALRCVPRAPNNRLSVDLLQLVGSDEFTSRRPEEKADCFRLLGTVSTADIIPELDSYLFPRRWLRSRRQRELQYLATLTLMTLDSDAAREKLRQVLPVADSGTRKAINDFLEGSRG